jgi:predicted ThiF/HesA family dinucleotide-utilizing enzyme
MRLRHAILPVMVAALAACDTPVGTAVARESARSVVNDVVETRFPGAPVTPLTDCIIDNATGSEVVAIARDSVLGTPRSETVQLVVEIAGRPDTVTCFVEEAGPLVLPRILAGSI